MAPDDESSAARLLGEEFTEQVDAVRRGTGLVRDRPPEGVHDTRVAARRLRSTLAAYRPLLDTRLTDPVRDELSWLAGALGPLREADVLDGRLAHQVEALQDRHGMVRGPVLARLRHDSDIRLGAARETAQEALTSDRVDQLLDSLADLAADPPWTDRAHRPVDEVMLPCVAHEWKRVRRKVDAAHAVAVTGDAAPGALDDLLHDVRKATKRARYAADPLVGLHGRDARRFVRTTKRIQSILGEHQDTVDARRQLLVLAGRAADAGEDGFTYGVLHEQQRQRSIRLVSEFTELWQRLHQRRLRAWLR